MKRPFKNWGSGLTSPLTDLIEIIPNDNADLPSVTRALYLGSAGDVRVTMISGDIVTLTNAPVGWHPLRVARVWQSGTTAPAICGGW